MARRPDNVRCFMDRERPCRDTCMAFVLNSTSRQKQCGILVVGNRLYEALESFQPKKTGAVHPGSPPPPEVKS